MCRTHVDPPTGCQIIILPSPQLSDSVPLSDNQFVQSRILLDEENRNEDPLLVTFPELFLRTSGPSLWETQSF